MIQAVAIFCEDIREEKSGQDTLIGVFPDNVNIGSVPSTLPKLAVYVRIHFNPFEDPGVISVRLELPGNQQLHMGAIEREVITKAMTEGQVNKHPVTGLISKVIASPFHLTEFGRIKAVVNINGVDTVLGTMNFKPIGKSISS